MQRVLDDRLRKLALVVPITVDLLLLGFFKYINMLLVTAQHIASALHHHIAIRPLYVVLPVGISFYTFHTITYIVDSYRRTITPTRNLFEFSAYVSLFSQLVAGPIVRFRQLASDLENIDHLNRQDHWEKGWSFFMIGMIEKVLIADIIATNINPSFVHCQSLSTVQTWLCVLGYTYQLYFDFCGYSDMAVGLGYMFGLRIPQNFNSPYKAVDIIDFWRRWHISLSSCLRDYLYIPMGGNRGTRLDTYRNILVTMLLGGLWHGANWTFVAWGVYHGLLLVLNRHFREQLEHVSSVLRQAMTFLVAIIGWTLFRSTDFSMAATLLWKMFIFQPGDVIVGTISFLPLLALAAYLAHVAPNTFEIRHEWPRSAAIALACLFLVCVTLVYGGAQSPFLYFQF